MQLSNRGRDRYALFIETTTSEGDPIPADEWEASFDRGTTWHACTVITVATEARSTWLLAGKEIGAGGGAVAVISANTRPLVRWIQNPLILVDRAPEIEYVVN